MEITGKVHCMFEQSGTFKNEFMKLGIQAEDYDIQDDFGQTDNKIDLFAEIERGYDGKPCVFDGITEDDLIMAFFPCIYFEALQMTYFMNENINLRNLVKKERYDNIIERAENRKEFYILLYKLVAICDMRNIRLIIENPAVQPHYLLFAMNFIPPTFIDKDRSMISPEYARNFICDFILGKENDNTLKTLF